MKGIWRIYPSTLITEIIIKSDFDFQIFDCEHGNYDYTSLSEDIRICKLLNKKSFVRVGLVDQIQVQRCLDMGADGIVFPQLKTVQEFKEALQTVNIHPKGNRGFNPFVYDYDFGFKKKTEKKECIVIIETLEAVSNLDEILSIKGIDRIYIGVYDLSTKLGCSGDLENFKVKKTLDEIILKSQKKKKPISLMVKSEKEFNYYKSKGVVDFVFGVDSYHLYSAFKNILPK